MVQICTRLPETEREEGGELMDGSAGTQPCLLRDSDSAEPLTWSMWALEN